MRTYVGWVVLVVLAACDGGSECTGEECVDAGDDPTMDAGTRDDDAGMPGDDAGDPPVDAGDPDACVGTTFYADTDGDGFGDPAAPETHCVLRAGLAESADDCDDRNDAIYPGATDVCNGLDDDCSGAADETFACAAGSPTSCTSMCGSTGTGTCTADCMPPGAEACTPPAEICNIREDDDCDGYVDEGVSVIEPTVRETFGTTVYDAPSIARPGSDAAAVNSFWLRGSDLYGFTHGRDPYATVTREVLIASTRARYDVSPHGHVLAYVDANGTNQGEIVVSRRNEDTLAALWTTRLSVALGGGQLYTDVRAVYSGTGGSRALTMVIARHRDGLLRSAMFDPTTGALLDETLLLATTTGDYAVTGDAVRWMLATTNDDPAGSSIDVLFGGTDGSSTRTISLGSDVVPRAVTVYLDADLEVVPSYHATVIWSEVRRDGTTPRIRYAHFPFLATTPEVGLVASATVPAPTLERRYLSVDASAVADTTLFLAAVEATGVGSEGIPRLYQIYLEPEPRVHLVGALDAGIHRRVDVDMSAGTGFGVLFHNRNSDPGIAWSPLGSSCM